MGGLASFIGKVFTSQGKLFYLKLIIILFSSISLFHFEFQDGKMAYNICIPVPAIA